MEQTKVTKRLKIDSRTLDALREFNNNKPPNLSPIVNSCLTRWVKRERKKQARKVALEKLARTKEEVRKGDMEGRREWAERNANRKPRKTASLSLTTALTA